MHASSIETTPRVLFTAVMDGRLPARPPVAAKIWVDLACRLTGTPFMEALNDPMLALRVIVDACLETGMDAARVFTFPLRKVELRDGAYIHVDGRGRRIGTVDIDGGWATHCDDPTDRDIARDDIMMGGMTMAQVRDRLGPDIPIMGGIDTLSFVNASPDDFTTEANRCLDAGAVGPYVLGSGCVVPRTARAENLRAMRPIAEAWAVRNG